MLCFREMGKDLSPFFFGDRPRLRLILAQLLFERKGQVAESTLCWGENLVPLKKLQEDLNSRPITLDQGQRTEDPED